VCVRACVCACERVCMHACVRLYTGQRFAVLPAAWTLYGTNPDRFRSHSSAILRSFFPSSCRCSATVFSRAATCFRAQRCFRGFAELKRDVHVIYTRLASTGMHASAHNVQAHGVRTWVSNSAIRRLAFAFAEGGIDDREGIGRYRLLLQHGFQVKIHKNKHHLNSE